MAKFVKNMKNYRLFVNVVIVLLQLLIVPIFAQAANENLPAGTRIDFPTGQYPSYLSFDNVTNSVFVTNPYSNTVSKIDVKSGVMNEYNGFMSPLGIVFDNITNSMWIANNLFGTNTVSKLDVSTGTKIDYSVGSAPAWVTFDNVTNSVWVTRPTFNTVSKINISTGSVVDYTTGHWPSGVAFDNVTNSVWVVNAFAGTVSKVDIFNGEKKDFVLLESAHHIAFDDITKSVWVTNDSSTISKIDIFTGERVDYPVGFRPFGIAFDNVTNSIWVTNGYDNTISKVNIFTGERVDYPVGRHPMGITFDNVTNSVWVSNYFSNTVSKVSIGDPWESPTPSQFWSQVQNAPNSWSIHRTAGIKIQGTQTDKPADDIIKAVPNDWVLRVATTTDEITSNSIELDGYQWYGVIDVTDGATGWIAAKNLADGTEYLTYDANNQTALEAKATSTPYLTKEARIPVIIDAVNNYYSASTIDSLYGDKGGFDSRNNFQTFIQGSTFPQKLVLAIAAHESAGTLDNEICGGAQDGGVGVMQITSTDSKGLGSGLKNYFKIGDCYGSSPKSKYYSNSLQGIYANIKDGLRTLQDKYNKLDSGKNEAVGNITVAEMKAISTVYRYNQGSPYKVQAVYSIFSGKGNDFTWNEYLHYAYRNNTRADGDIWMNKVRNACVAAATFNDCLQKTNVAGLTTSAFYLRDIGNSLKSSIFGSNYEDSVYGDKLITANTSQVIVFLRSPAELRVINSLGEITGSIAGVSKEEIANSIYDAEQKFVTILFPQEQYKYRVVGLETGEYGLSGEFVNNGEFTPFDADNIPITGGEVHDYVIDQDKLSRCELGAVTLSIDYQGDGVIERTVKGGCRVSEIVPPVVDIVSPVYQYLLNATTTIQFTASDASGIASTTAILNGVLVSNWQTVTLTRPGANVLEVSVMDNEGNTTTASSIFNVLYATNGFLPPVKLDGSGVYNQGRTIPVKFELRDVVGNIPAPAPVSLYVAKVSNGIVGNDEIPLSVSSADIGNQFRYDSNGHMYIYNLSTDSMTTGTWQIRAVIDGGQEIKVVISIK